MDECNFSLSLSLSLKQKACMLSRRSCSPAAVQDSKTTSSAYTRADTHLPMAHCGMLLRLMLGTCWAGWTGSNKAQQPCCPRTRTLQPAAVAEQV